MLSENQRITMKISLVFSICMFNLILITNPISAIKIDAKINRCVHRCTNYSIQNVFDKNPGQLHKSNCPCMETTESCKKQLSSNYRCLCNTQPLVTSTLRCSFNYGRRVGFRCALKLYQNCDNTKVP